MVSRELAVFSVFFIAMAYGQSYSLTEVSLHFLKDFFAKKYIFRRNQVLIGQEPLECYVPKHQNGHL